MSSLHRCLSTAKPSQLAINHKPQICRRLSLKNYFFKAFACCSLQVYLKYLKNESSWAVPVSVITQVGICFLVVWRVLFVFRCVLLLMSGCFQLTLACPGLPRRGNTLATFAKEKSGLQACQGRCTSGWAWNASCCTFLLIFHFRFHLSDRCLGNTAFQRCIYGHTTPECQCSWVGSRKNRKEMSDNGGRDTSKIKHLEMWYLSALPRQHCLLLLKGGIDDEGGCGWDILAVWAVTMIITVERKLHKRKKKECEYI